MMSRQGIIVVIARCCGIALGLLSLVPAYFTLWARIDTSEDLTFLRVWDTLLGLPVAAAILLLGAGAKSKWTTPGKAAAA
jgi:hypothetical protein